MDSRLKLGIRDGQIAVTNLEDGSERCVPLAQVDGISVFGCAQLSTQLIRACISENIQIGYYSEDGHYFGSISSNQHIDPGRQKRQIMLTDDAGFCLEWSRRIIEAKIRNSISLLVAMGDVYDFTADDLAGLYHSLGSLKSAETVDMVLGFEGNAAKAYFTCLPKVLRNEDFAFRGRSSRPPRDPFNSLLSYGYSLLYRDIIGAIDRHGVHPYFAFMHRLRFGHAALASDLIEEFRAPLVDRTVVDLVNEGVVELSDFQKNESGAFYLRKDAARRVINRFSEAIVKDCRYFLSSGDRKSYGFQAMLDKKIVMLLRAIELRDASAYQPFVWEPGQ